MEEVVVAVCWRECFDTVLQYRFYGAGSLTRGRYIRAPETQYLAFYINRPTSAITHYARVIARETDVLERDTQGWYNRLYNTDHHHNKFYNQHWFYTAYHIEEPMELEEPILRGDHIMTFGRKPTTMYRLLNADTVADLF